MFSPLIENLIESFERLPSIGRKTATRLAFHIIEMKNKEAQEFLNSIVEAKRRLKKCDVCHNISENSPCEICLDDKRNKDILCIVEDAKDIITIEKTHEYNGKYHVLGGAISPMLGIKPDNLFISDIIERIKKDEIKEIIIACNPKIEGEATALYIAKLLKEYDVKITRIAHGLPIGSDIEFADEITLAKALNGRREIE